MKSAHDVFTAFCGRMKRKKGTKSRMEYITATSDMVDAVHDILHTAIKTIYPKYYPKEVAEFFFFFFSKEHILDGIMSGNMGVLVVENVIAGAGGKRRLPVMWLAALGISRL